MQKIKDVPTMSHTPPHTRDRPTTAQGLGWDPTTHYLDPVVAKSYDAERFDSLAGRVYQRLEKRALLAAFRTVPRAATILDLPCGTGRLAAILLQAGYRVVGADISPAMLQEARARLGRFNHRFTTEMCDARDIAQQGARFDAALCARVLMHFPLDGQIRFLSGVAAAVRGHVVISHSLDTRYQRFRRAVKGLLGHQRSAGYPVTEQHLEQLLAAANLREVGRWRVNRMVSEAVVVLAARCDPPRAVA